MFDVLGIENPIVDLQARVPDAFLAQVEVTKNTMQLVAVERQREVLQLLGERPIEVAAGGSCANTMLGLAQLGARTAYCGAIGADDYGASYRQQLQEQGVTPFLAHRDGVMTGSCLIMVTPDAARSMLTCLGASQRLTPADLPREAIAGTGMLYLTGYAWDTPTQQETVREALALARRYRSRVAFSLADPFCVNRHRLDFLELISTQVDVLLANRDEALSLLRVEHAQQALDVLRRWCQTVVLTLGERGALIAADGEQCYVEAESVVAQDTTGAGDSFAAGFLYGRLRGADLLRSGRLGAAFAAEVVQQMGGRLQGDVRLKLGRALNL